MGGNNNNLQDSVYYSRIVMMIIYVVQLILLIYFIVAIHNFNDIMSSIYDHHYTDGTYDAYDFRIIFNEHNQDIDTCFAFFIISLFVFLLEFITYFTCPNHVYNFEYFNTIF